MLSYMRCSIVLLCCFIFSCSPPVGEREDVTKLIHQAKQHFDKKEYGQSISFAKKALEIDFRNQRAYEILALSYEFQHDCTLALETWHKLIFSKDTSREKAATIEKKVQQLKMIIRDMKALDRSLDNNDTKKLKELEKKYAGSHFETIVLMKLADYYVNKDEKKKAREYYRKIVEEYPDAPENEKASKQLETLASK